MSTFCHILFYMDAGGICHGLNCNSSPAVASGKPTVFVEKIQKHFTIRRFDVCLLSHGSSSASQNVDGALLYFVF